MASTMTSPSLRNGRRSDTTKKDAAMVVDMPACRVSEKKLQGPSDKHGKMTSVVMGREQASR